MNMFSVLFESLYFFLPAYAANICAALSCFLPFPSGSKPINKKLFGKNKTYRGLFYGMFGGLLIAVFFSTVSLGALLSFGALAGDMAGSAIKRKLDIKEGRPFIFLDQLDFVIGGLGFGSIYYLPSRYHIIILVSATLILHPFVNLIAYNFKLKKVWW